jgi:glyoxylase-like metal-dependent hydrolase (beta-lactamase superfamily II)
MTEAELGFDKTNGWFYAWDLGGGIWRISDCGKDNIYLVIGGESALVFDTGHGAEDLLGFVKGLSDLPLKCAISHCHFDHAGGCGAFDWVYGGAADIMGLHMDGAEAKQANARKNRSFPEGYVLPKDVYVPKGSGRTPEDLFGTPGRLGVKTLSDGDRIDLGGRALRCLATPGHTPGSICLLDERTGVLFTGDTYVPNAYWGPMWLHISHSEPLSVFLRSLRKMRASGAAFMASGHGECGLIPIARLDPLVEMVEGIVAGSIIGDEIETFIGPGLNSVCGDGEESSAVTYDPQRLVSR